MDYDIDEDMTEALVRNLAKEISEHVDRLVVIEHNEANIETLTCKLDMILQAYSKLMAECVATYAKIDPALDTWEIFEMTLNIVRAEFREFSIAPDREIN